MCRIAPLLLAAACLEAGAVSVVTLEARSSVNHFYWYGGFAISGDEGHDGAPLPAPGPPWEGVEVTDFAPVYLAIAGSAYKELSYLFWSGFLAETWSQSQGYHFSPGSDGVRIGGTGHATITQDSIICSDITGCSLATESHRSTNIQALEFSLSEANPYRLVGSTSGGQWLDLAVWNSPGGRWMPVVHGPTQTASTGFDLGGTLQPGRYLLRNFNGTFRAGGADNVVNAWSYTFDLPGAVAAPVPEPSPAVLWGLALAGLLLIRHRRPGTE